jgi:sensor domain CHASE-containing protein
MNEFQPATETSDQIAALRYQMFLMLLSLVIIGASLAGYLYLQDRFTRRDIAVLKPQAAQVVEAFNQNRGAIQSFVQQLAAYGQTHPDFQQQVLRKYGITPQTVAGMKK